MGNINVDVDNSEMLKHMKKMRVLSRDTPKTFVKTVNSTLSSMKTYTQTAISKVYTIDKKYVGQKIRVKKISKNLGGGEIISTHRPTFVNRFEHTANTTPGIKGGAYVRVKVKGKSSLQPIQGAFIAPIKNRNGDSVGKTGVFVRTQRTKMANGRTRNGRDTNSSGILEAQFAPGVTSMMNNNDVQKVVVEKTQKRFDKALDKAIEKTLKEAGR